MLARGHPPGAGTAGVAGRCLDNEDGGKVVPGLTITVADDGARD
jgi:hypothetical protein